MKTANWICPVALCAAGCITLGTPMPVAAQTGVDMGCSPTKSNNYCAATSAGTGTSAIGGSTLSPAMQEAASLLGAAIGSSLRKALFGDPAEDARRAALLQQEQAILAENARLRKLEDDRRRNEMFQRLMGSLKLSGISTLEMKGFDGDNGALTLKGVNVQQSGGGNTLGLKLGEPSKVDDDLRPAGTAAFEEQRTSESPVSPAPNTDPMVVDLRDVQHSAVLVQSVETASPNDAPLILDEALEAANGDKSFIGNVPAGVTLPSIDPAGLMAFQAANADYRRANDSRMHVTEIFSLAQKRRERADQLAAAAIADLEQSKAALADETTLARKHQLMSAIFADLRTREEAFAKATADLESARAKKYNTGQEAIRVLRAVSTGKAPATFNPPIPSLVDLDEATWGEVKKKIDAGWDELERQGAGIKAALASLKLPVPDKYERVREGVILGARTDKADAAALGTVRSPFANKTHHEMNAIAEAAKKGGIDDVGGAIAVSFGTRKMGTVEQGLRETVRFAGDHFTDGLVSLRTPEGKEALEQLRGKAFDRLIAHSNGSPIAEALIEAGQIKVNELNIVGGDRSLLNGHRLQRLLDEGKVKRVVVWINLNDPVVWASSLDQLRLDKLGERSNNSLEHIARKISGNLGGGNSGVQFRYMVGNEPYKGDIFAQHRLETAYYRAIGKYLATP